MNENLTEEEKITIKKGIEIIVSINNQLDNNEDPNNITYALYEDPENNIRWPTFDTIKKKIGGNITWVALRGQEDMEWDIITEVFNVFDDYDCKACVGLTIEEIKIISWHLNIRIKMNSVGNHFYLLPKISVTPSEVEEAEKDLLHNIKIGNYTVEEFSKLKVSV